MTEPVDTTTRPKTTSDVRVLDTVATRVDESIVDVLRLVISVTGQQVSTPLGRQMPRAYYAR
jgi:hypothetical protein